MKKFLLKLSVAFLLAAAGAAQANPPEVVYDPQGRLIPHDVKKPQMPPEPAAAAAPKKKAAGSKVGKRQSARSKAAPVKGHKRTKARRP